uniref:Uncharacterized protein n=1 Tax=Odontella aurita TaxID=265563 RepID=A0A7S4N8P2_9STRA
MLAANGTSPTSPRSHPNVYINQTSSYDTMATSTSGASSRAPSMARSEATSPTSNSALSPRDSAASQSSRGSADNALSPRSSSSIGSAERRQNSALAMVASVTQSATDSATSSTSRVESTDTTPTDSTPVVANASSSSAQGSGSGSGSGAHPRLLADLKRLRSSRTPAINASRIIGALCKSSRTEKGRAAIGRAGAIPCIVAAMCNHPSDAEVQERGCAALQNLALEGDRRSMIASAGGTAAVLRAMRSHPQAAAVQERGCGAVRNFVWDNDVNRAAVGSKGGVVVITDAVRGHGGDGRVVGQAFRALRNLAKGTGEDVSSNRLAIGGAVMCIVAAMRQHLEDEGVEAEGCALVRNLSVDEDVRPAIVAVGAIGAIVAAMKEHPKSEKVNSQACGSLYNLSFCGGSLDEMKRDKYCKRVLKAAAKLFPKVCGKYANNLLERMAAASSRKSKFGSSPTPPHGAMSPVDFRGSTPTISNVPTSPRGADGAGASGHHSSSPPGLKMFGMKRSGGKSGSGPTGTESVSSGGTGDEDSRQSGSDAGSSASLTTMMHVMALRDNVDSLSEEEAVTIITELGKLAMGPPPSALSSSSRGRNSGSHGRPPSSAIHSAQGYRAAIAAAGGIPVVVSFMARRIDWPPIQSSACLTLRNLCHRDEDNCMAAARSGAIPAVIAGMQLHRSWSGVQSAGCEALRTFATSAEEGSGKKEVQGMIRETGGTRAIMDGARENIDDVRVVECALAARAELRRLSSR